jgi:hypothetical protein
MANFGLDDWTWFLAVAVILNFYHNVQTDSGTCLALCLVDSRGIFCLQWNRYEIDYSGPYSVLSHDVNDLSLAWEDHASFSYF